MRTRLIPGGAWFTGAGVLLATLCLAGCGEAGPKLNPIEGEVTYVGKPIGGGKIRFVPLGDKVDPRAAPELAFNGSRYRLPRGKGVIGGKYAVYITATDGKPDGENVYGTPLFNTSYMTEVTLPAEGGTFNFEIPEQGKGKKK